MMRDTGHFWQVYFLRWNTKVSINYGFSGNKNNSHLLLTFNKHKKLPQVVLLSFYHLVKANVLHFTIYKVHKPYFFRSPRLWHMMKLGGKLVLFAVITKEWKPPGRFLRWRKWSWFKWTIPCLILDFYTSGSIWKIGQVCPAKIRYSGTFISNREIEK